MESCALKSIYLEDMVNENYLQVAQIGRASTKFTISKELEELTDLEFEDELRMRIEFEIYELINTLRHLFNLSIFDYCGRRTVDQLRFATVGLELADLEKLIKQDRYNFLELLATRESSDLNLHSSHSELEPILKNLVYDVKASASKFTPKQKIYFAQIRTKIKMRFYGLILLAEDIFVARYKCHGRISLFNDFLAKNILAHDSFCQFLRAGEALNHDLLDIDTFRRSFERYKALACKTGR